MISKGTTHNNGAKLAAYMEASQKGQRAELWELRGFGVTTLKDAFRCVDVMAGATKAQQPFFHVQVRNREGETLTKQQFEYAADRIERMLGLTGQPRAITFHTYEHNNDQHMHVAWSRIDQDTLTAKPLPFFKDRLKKISRELELHFGLEPVTNHREGHIKFAPTRAEHEQARRLGLDVHQVRNNIRNCWDRSDCGTSFQAALEHDGMILAQGDQRGFVVIDRQGGIHALGKRIVDMTASKIRNRLSDLLRDELPTVDMARSFIEEQRQEKQRPEQTKPEPMWDRDRDDRAWQDAVINAAIDKEKTERNFVEPEQSREGVGGRKEERLKEQERKQEARQKAVNENHWPTHPPADREQAGFEQAATEATHDQRPDKLKGPAGRLWQAWQRYDTDRIVDAAISGQPVSFRPPSRKDFAASLDDMGFSFAAVTKDEAYRSQREAEFARAIGRYAPRFKEAEIVLVTEQRPEYRRNGEIVVPGRIHKLDQSLAEKFVNHLGIRGELQGIDATLSVSDKCAQQRATDREATRLERATSIKDFSRDLPGKAVRQGGKTAKTTLRAFGKTLDALSDAFDSLLSPKLTPQQLRDGEIAKDRRDAQAEDTIDFDRFTAETAQRRQQREQELEAERQRQRERGGRDR